MVEGLSILDELVEVGGDSLDLIASKANEGSHNGKVLVDKSLQLFEKLLEGSRLSWKERNMI